MSREVTCERCGQVFEPDWSEGEAEAEYQRLWPAESKLKMDRAILCDECFQAFMKWWVKEGAAKMGGLS